MKVIPASSLGMCFGVRDAIRAAERVTEPSAVTILGELVHNPEVRRELARRGFRQAPEGDDAGLPDTPAVMVTAHGISDRRRAGLAASGRTLIDTTCPLVRHVHDSAQTLQGEGRFVIVIGRPGHVEVRGITEDLGRFAVVDSPEAVRAWGEPRLGIVCQSTTPPQMAEELRAAIAAANPASDIAFLDTICRPTRDRQAAVLELLPHIEVLVVVGGANSNNSLQLALLARSRGVPAVLVDGAAGLDLAALRGYRVAGLTAGTSTMDRTIREVHVALLGLKPLPPPLPTASQVVRSFFRPCNPDEACL